MIKVVLLFFTTFIVTTTFFIAGTSGETKTHVIELTSMSLARLRSVKYEYRFDINEPTVFIDIVAGFDNSDDVSEIKIQYGSREYCFGSLLKTIKGKKESVFQSLAILTNNVNHLDQRMSREFIIYFQSSDIYYRIKENDFEERWAVQILLGSSGVSKVSYALDTSPEEPSFFPNSLDLSGFDFSVCESKKR